MAKSNQIKKLVNGEIADADDINDIVESAGNEGGAIPYDPATDQRDTTGSQSLGATAYPWGSLYLNRDAILGEVDPVSNTLAASITISLLRTFLNLKDVTESSFTGHGGQNVKVNLAETGLEFKQGESIPQQAEIFTSSGTWTRPAGVDRVYVVVQGAGGTGGAGGGSGTFFRGGGGGGGGGYAEGSIEVSGNVTITISSSVSSFAGDTTILGNAGSDGVAGTSGGAVGTGGSGGTASGGMINISGDSGSSGTSSTNGVGGRGGDSYLGGGGYGHAQIYPSSNGSKFGGGGGGGGLSAGAGGIGKVIVYY